MERFASAWAKLIIACHVRKCGGPWLKVIIACDVRGRGEWLHCCNWPPLQLACTAYRLFAHAFRLQTDRHYNWVTYCVFRLYRQRMQKKICVLTSRRIVLVVDSTGVDIQRLK